MNEAKLTRSKRIVSNLSSITLFFLLSIADSQAEMPQPTSTATQHSSQIPLTQPGAGSFNVNVMINGMTADFLLDTGASMVTVSSALFEQLQEHTEMIRVSRIGARLASGKVEVLDVYRVSSFSLGSDCELGPLEIAVLKHGGRNLLGMNALQQAASISLSFAPPILSLAGCAHRLEAIR